MPAAYSAEAPLLISAYQSLSGVDAYYWFATGDDEWTPREQRRALETAATVYPGRANERDIEAMARVLDVGRSEEGALGLLRFFMQLELERAVHASRFLPTYLAQHPASVARIAAGKTAGKDHASE